MIHATNHPDGCLLMVDNICKRRETWHDVQSGGQQSLFHVDCDNQYVDESIIEECVLEHFSQCTHEISLSVALAVFFVKNGPICSTGDVAKVLKKFERSKRLDVIRNPDKTTTGKPPSFMTEGKGKTVSVRWLQ